MKLPNYSVQTHNGAVIELAETSEGELVEIIKSADLNSSGRPYFMSNKWHGTVTEWVSDYKDCPRLPRLQYYR